MLDACEAERATIEEVYPLSSQEAIPPEQFDQITATLQPTPECCNAAQPFADSSCQCDDLVANVLPNVGVEQPGLISTMQILSQTCANTGVEFSASAC